MKNIWVTFPLVFKSPNSAELCLDHLRSVGAVDVSLSEDGKAISGQSYSPEFGKIIHTYVYGSFSIKNIQADANSSSGWVKLYDVEGEEKLHVELDDVLAGLVLKPKKTVIMRIDSSHPIFDNEAVADIGTRFQDELNRGASLDDLKKQLFEGNENHDYDFAVQSVAEHVHESNGFDYTDYFIQLELA